MKQYLIGIDAGNTMVKAAAFDLAGRTLAVASSNTASLHPAPGMVENDPDALWLAAAQAVRDCISAAEIDPRAVLAVGAAGHGNGLYLLDKSGKGLMGIQSMDSRAAVLARALDAEHGSEILSLAYTRPWAAMTPVLLRWLAENRADVLEQAGKALLCKDVIVHGLTGRIGSDVSDLSGCGLLALPSLRYDDELLGLYGLGELRSLLPDVAESNEVVGQVTAEAARMSGLVQGTPVVAGLFDVLASTLGAGATQTGEASIVAGSWSINQVFSRHLPERPRAFLASVLGKDTWVSCEASPTSAANLEWFVKNFLSAEAKTTGDDPFALCNRLANDADSSGDLPVFLPYIYGGPVAGARGGFNDIGAWHGRAEMVRALFEGIAFGHRAHFEVLDPDRKIKVATLSGGASKSELWVQILADTLGMRLRISDCQETGARGAAMAAAIGAGIFPDYTSAASRMATATREILPNPAEGGQLETRYRRWRNYRDALESAWTR